MSSTYSSQNTTPRCQNCGASLGLRNPRCANCGFYNRVPPTNNGQQQLPQPPSSWNSPHQPVQQSPSMQRFDQQQGQADSQLQRYPAPPEQRNRYNQPTSYQVPPQQSQAIVSPAAFGMPQSMPQNNISQLPVHSLHNADNTYGYQSGQLTNNVGRHAQQQPPSFYKEPESRRRPQVGRIIGVCALLIALIGASFLAYTFLFAQKNTQSDSGGTTPKAAATNPVPKGNPLFQDAFASNTNGWSIQSYPGEFSVSLGNGALKLENDSHKLLWELIPGSKTYADFQLSVDATLSKGSQDNGYGVYIRGALSQNMSITAFYRFELYGDGSFAIFKGTTDANGVTTTPRLVDYTNSSAIQKQGGVNHIAINATGSKLQFMVNNQVLSTITDTAYTSGVIALFVSNLQDARPGAEATFAHLALYPAQK